MTEQAPAPLAEAAERLHQMPWVSAPISSLQEEPGYAVQYSISLCLEGHEGRGDLDSNGRCGQCEFLFTYDRQLAEMVRAFLAAAPAVVRLLRSWDGIEISEHHSMPDDYRHALAVARAITGGVDE